MILNDENESLNSLKSRTVDHFITPFIPNVKMSGFQTQGQASNSIFTNWGVIDQVAIFSGKNTVLLCKRLEEKNGFTTK